MIESQARRRLLIVGASGHAKVVVDAVRAAQTMEVVGFADRDRSAGELILGLPVLGRDSEVKQLMSAHRIDAVVIAVGDNWTRAQLAAALKADLPNLRFAVVVHPRAYVSPDATLGDGTVVFAGAVVNPGSRVGQHCVINTKASVDHDCVLEDYVTVGPGATLGGNVTIGTHSTIALGANVIHSISIGRHTVLGAGATAVSDLDDQVVAFGVPARTIRSRLPHERNL